MTRLIAASARQDKPTATERLTAALRAANAVPTLDMGRNNKHPCTFCGKPPDGVHELVDIGTYPNGEKLTRPVCSLCIPLVERRK